MKLTDLWARLLCKLSSQLVRREHPQEVVMKCLPHPNGPYGITIWHGTPDNALMQTTMLDYVEISAHEKYGDLRESIFRG